MRAATIHICAGGRAFSVCTRAQYSPAQNRIEAARLAFALAYYAKILGRLGRPYTSVCICGHYGPGKPANLENCTCPNGMEKYILSKLALQHAN